MQYLQKLTIACEGDLLSLDDISCKGTGQTFKDWNKLMCCLSMFDLKPAQLH